MLGVSLVGLSGSMIKEAAHAPGGTIPDADEHGLGSNLTVSESLVVVSKVLVRALRREENENIPAATSALVGVFFIIFAQVL